MVLWMKVSPDIYELPELVCGSLSELSFKTGIRTDKILNEIRYNEKSGRHGRFARTNVEEWTEEEEKELTDYFRKEQMRAKRRTIKRHNWQKRYWTVQQ